MKSRKHERHPESEARRSPGHRWPPSALGADPDIIMIGEATPEQIKNLKEMEPPELVKLIVDPGDIEWSPPDAERGTDDGPDGADNR